MGRSKVANRSYPYNSNRQGIIVGSAIVVGDPVVRDTAEKSRPCPVTLNTVVVSVTGFADLRYTFLREQKSHAQFLAVGTYDSRRVIAL
jgi:hypothetical protein